MARTHRLSHTSVTDRLRSEPRRFGFFQAVRLIERASARAGRLPDRALVGDEITSRQRSVAFRAATNLSHPVSEIDAIAEPPADPPEMAVEFIGLTGPSGVLPQHYTVTLLRETRRRNTALRDFLDIFNHRLIAFFYRAWAKYRIPISVERGGSVEREGASETLRALIGFGTDHLDRTGDVTPHALLHYSGLLGHFPRNAVSLERLLNDYLRLPVKIEPFAGRWLTIPESQQSRLGDYRRGRFVALGADAVIGASYWDVQGSFSILIGAIGYADFIRFMPNSKKLGELVDLIRIYIDPQLGFDIRLQLARQEIPRLRLDSDGTPGPRLGWNTWLRHDPPAQDACDAVWQF